jgi:hypothetical protein
MTILSEKAAFASAEIASRLELEFFTRYFGDNPVIHRFVRYALVVGRSDVAQEVNRAIKILGSPHDDEAALRFITNVQQVKSFGLHPWNTVKNAPVHTKADRATTAHNFKMNTLEPDFEHPIFQEEQHPQGPSARPKTSTGGLIAALFITIALIALFLLLFATRS